MQLDENYYETAQDLLDVTFNKDLPLFGNPINVTKEYVARPDLISYAVYGSDEYADIICKLNGISNPFELNEGDIVVCPAPGHLMAYYKIQNDISGISGFASEEDTVKYNDRSNELKRKPNEKRAPYEQLENEQNFIIDKTHNLIYY